MPTVRYIRRAYGVAGQIAYTAVVRHPGDPADGAVTFVGSIFGGPVVAIIGGQQTFVDDPDRFGPRLSPDWVRRFFRTI